MKKWSYIVRPNLPERLMPLRKIAYNLWYSWNWQAVELFMRLGKEYWEQSYQNPVRMLGLIPQERYNDIMNDDSFLANMDRIDAEFEKYMNEETWFQKTHGDVKGKVAYFSFEFGLDEGLPVYSGGLGVLAGDHLKSASDLGIPLCGVGLLYREGYFRQFLNADGYQQEEYPENDWYTMPVNLVTGDGGQPIKISCELPDGDSVTAQIWKVQVGRVNLFLLDANIPENKPEHRSITDQLYGGDKDMRIRQEILLGIGGLRALWAMGMEPSVCHMNEGHSAFLALERISHFMQNSSLKFEQAKELVWASNVFTTHTPVPAGNERFDPALVDKYIKPYIAKLGITWDQCLTLGRENPGDQHEAFCMTVLALKLAAHCNAVAKLHGVVSRDMWKNMWPTLPVSEVPIGHVTNGVHARNWLSHDMEALFKRYLGPRFTNEPTNYEIFNRIDDIPDSEIWRTHERRRERMVGFIRNRCYKRFARRGASSMDLKRAEEVLDPDALTIGFARRFATYKRGTLLFRDIERLSKILNNPEKPVQLIFAGKSHPHDEPGKALIREIFHRSRDERFIGKIVFVEDYDIAVARYLTQGVDVWLNTPRRPLEASGTSGMKAAIGGAVNVSILDGWWDEGYTPDVGFAIDNRERYNDPELQDNIESRALYDLLEQEVIPLFFNRGRDGLPRGWIKMMKTGMRDLGKFFNTNRMLQEYTENLYIPAISKYFSLSENDMDKTKILAKWRSKLEREWPLVKVSSQEVTESELYVDSCLTVNATVQLGGLTSDDVSVELFYGSLDSKGEIENGKVEIMKAGEQVEGGIAYKGCIPCDKSGRFGFGVRVLPKHSDLCHPYMPGVIHWAE